MLSESGSGSSNVFTTKRATERVAVVDSMLDCLSCVSSADGENRAGWESSSSDDLDVVDIGGGAVA